MAASEDDLINQGEDESSAQFHCEANSDRLLADIINFLPDPTFVIDKRGRVISWNRAIENLTGIKSEDILGKGNYEYAIPVYGFRRPILADLVLNQDPKIESEYDSLQRDGKNLTCEVFVPSLGHNGSYFWAKAAPLYDSSGDIVGAIESLRDITDRKRSKEALNESEAKFRLLFERSADAMLLLDGGKFVDCNKAALDMMKCSDKEDLLNLHPSQTASERQPDGHLSFEKAEEMMRMAFEKGTHRFEWVCRRKNGEEFPVEATLTVIPWRDRQILHLIRKDITERKQAEYALKESENKYRAIFENTGAATVIIEEDGVISLANAEFERLTGYSKEEVEGKKKWIEFVVKDDLEKMLKYHCQRRETTDLTPRSYELRIKDKIGQTKDILLAIDTIPGTEKSVASLLDISKRKQAEIAYQENLRFLQNLIDAIPNSIFYKDTNGIYQGCNSAFEKFLGLSKEEIIGKSVYDLYPEDLADSYRKMDQALFDKPGSEVYESSLLYVDGTRHDVVFNKATYTDANGRLSGLVGIVLDITKRKRAEEALKTEKERAEQYLNITEVILVALDADARITLLNRKGYQLLGYDEGELTGMDWIKTCLRPQDRDSVHWANSKIIACEIDPFEYYEGYIIDKKGQERLISWHTTVIKNGEGRIIGTLSSGEDITERRKTEEKNLQLADIVKSSSDAIFGTLNGTITSWNKGAERIYGYTEDEIIGRPVTILVSPETPGKFKKILERLRNGEHVDGHESICIRKDGEQFPVDLSISPIYDTRGEFIGTSSIVRDITERKNAEEKLRWNAALLEAQVESSLDGILVVDKHGKRVVTNRRLLTMFNVPQSIICEEKDEALLEYVVGRVKNPDRFLEKVMYLYRHQNETSRDEIEFKDGLVVDRYSSPVIGRGGEYYGRIWTFRDITERKRAEEALRESEGRYRNLVERANDGIIVVQDGLIKYANSRSGMIWDSTVEEIIGKSFTDYIYPDEIPRIVERYRRRMANEYVEPIYETILKRKNGTKIFVELNAGLISFKGKPADLVIVRDISERKQAEEELRASNQILDGIINTIPVRVFWKDRNLVYLGCNAIFANDAGFADSKDIVGKDDYQMGWRDQAELYRSNDRQVIESGCPKLLIEEPQTTPEGNTIVLLTSKIPLCNSDGKIIGVLGIYMDITERKRMESELLRSRDELEQRVKERTEELAGKNAEMERFIYTVSHDLRTPLISMSGFLGFLKADAEKGDMKRLDEDLRIVSDAVTKMDRLLLDTLELSRIGRIVNPPVDVLFGEIVSEALAQSSSKMSSKNVEITVEEDLPIVQVDRMRLVEVLINLVENSLKYMGDQPHPEIEIGKRLDGEKTVFFVRDNGIGIDPSQHNKVFELFYKVDKRSEGSGAGLAIVKKIIEVHGGRIWIESELGKGCTVCFTLPLGVNSARVDES